MNHEIDIQYASDAAAPDEEAFRRWAEAALASQSCARELTIRVADAEEIQQLNRDYRGKDYPTNVLSFCAELPDDIDIPLLGDIIICPQVVAREALEQDKPLEAHWAHMAVHGVLHLLGYDHIDDIEADEMEALEIAILAKLGYPDPYNHGDIQAL